jgi:hypothetical protein
MRMLGNEEIDEPLEVVPVKRLEDLMNFGS